MSSRDDNQRLTIILPAVVALLTTIVGAYVSIKVSETNKTVEKIHVATNSGRTEMLRLVVAQTRRIAELTNDPQDIAVHQRALADLAAAEQATRSLERKDQ